MDIVKLKNQAQKLVGKYKYPLLILLLGLALMLIPGSLGGEEATVPDVREEAPAQADMNAELAEILSQISGAGKVKVMLTVASGEKVIYQEDVDIAAGENGSQRHDTVIVTDSDRNQTGLVTRVDPPVYLGAIIVCQGADKASVRLAIVEAVCKVTGLGADRISVLKMK